MRINVNLDEKVSNELVELTKISKTSKSELVREALNELYLKEKRAKENLIFFIDLFNKGVITKDLLFLLLPRNDAEAIIIGAKFGKEGADFVKETDY
ncbi:ribbon-helix-helix protein, CopG family [Candidatus Pacearchaeota archaeon]|nr:ribbon-helix-helix protein, CopG family [Candidatus Pacearchaeota archaeon]